MKKIIVRDEWYPVYCFTDVKYEWNSEAEIGDKELAWMQSVFEQFDQVQERLAELYGEGK